MQDLEAKEILIPQGKGHPLCEGPALQEPKYNADQSPQMNPNWGYPPQPDFPSTYMYHAKPPCKVV